MAKFTPEEIVARRKERKAARERAKRQAKSDHERNGREVKRVVIGIEWKRSRTWGNCPRATADVFYADEACPHRTEIASYASGCGYDKESTVVADILNKCLLYTLWKHDAEEFKGDIPFNYREGVSTKRRVAPYGVSAYEYDGVEGRRFDGGVGMSCYTSPEMARFIGGAIRHAAEGKSFDVYEWESGRFE